VINITTRTTIVSNVQLDDNIRIWLLKEEGFKSTSETWKCRHQNNVFGQSIPDPRSRNVEGPTTDCRQSEHRHHQVTGAAHRPCRSATQSSGPRCRGAVSCRTLYVLSNCNVDRSYCFSLLYNWYFKCNEINDLDEGVIPVWSSSVMLFTAFTDAFLGRGVS